MCGEEAIRGSNVNNVVNLNGFMPPSEIPLSNARLAPSKPYLSSSSNLFNKIQDLIGEIDPYSLREMDAGEASGPVLSSVYYGATIILVEGDTGEDDNT